MNSKFQLFIFFALTTLISFSQTDIKLGIKGGINLSGYHTGKSANTDQINFHLGGISEFKLSKLVSLQADLLYSKKGGLIHLWVTDRYIQIDSRLHYIDIPLQIKFYPINKLSFDLGPQVGFLIHNKEKSVDREDQIEFLNTNSIEFSLTGGLTYKLEENLLIQTRYNYGLIEIFETERYKNSVISLSLGYFIN